MDQSLSRGKIVLRSFILLAIVGLLAHSADLSAQSLKETVESTLRTNPDVLVSKYSVDAAEQLKAQARSGYFPSVDLVIAGGRESSNNTTTRAAGVDDLKLTREERSFKVTQMLYDGFATKNLVRQQEALTEAATSRLVSTQENIGLRAIQVYLEVLRRANVVDLTYDA